MNTSVKTIAVVQGAPSAVVQDLFRDLATRWAASARIAGAIAEDHGLPDRKCTAGYLRSIGSGARYPIFHDLGPGSEACHLSASEALTATAAVERDIAAGCDLVILSKYGKLEAAGEGLRPALVAAIEAHIPVLTSASPKFEAAFAAFAAPLFVVLPADAERIEAWRRDVLARPRAPRKRRAIHTKRHCEPTGPRFARPDDRLREAMQPRRQGLLHRTRSSQ